MVDRPAMQQPEDLMTIRQVAEAHAQIVKDLDVVDRIQAAATFAGLMLLPELQANHLRLEILAHLSILYGNRSGTVEPAFLQRSFEQAGERLMEDPSEDVFTAIVHNGHGNFRIREGLCEGATFHLQRVLNIISEMPHKGA